MESADGNHFGTVARISAGSISFSGASLGECRGTQPLRGPQVGTIAGDGCMPRTRRSSLKSQTLNKQPKIRAGENQTAKSMSTSSIQNRWQAYGPHRPTVEQFQKLLGFLPKHLEIQAIAIKGQGGGVVIEVYHDNQDMVYAFEEDENGDLQPSSAEREKQKKESGL